MTGPKAGPPKNTDPRVGAVARWLVMRLAPEEWRDALIGDLEEDARCRRGRLAGAVWSVAAAAAYCGRIRWSRRGSAFAMPTGGSSAPMLELAHAIRALVRRPAFAAITILTLTLGIAAATCVFSVANWLMWRPVPGVAEAGRLATFRKETADGGSWAMSMPEFRQLSTLPALSSVAGRASDSLNVAPPGGIPARLSAELTSSNYFATLGQRMTLGRPFEPADDVPGANVVIVSDRYWEAALESDPAVVGRTLTINGHPFVVIGVAARGFHGPDRAGGADVWVPLVSMSNNPADLLSNTHIGVFLSAVGRLTPGATIEQVNAQAEALRLPPMQGVAGTLHFMAQPGLDLPAWQREGLRQTVLLLLGAVALLLVLTCANVANLMCAHAHARRAELATRQALGASRARVVRQLLLEGLILSSIGAAISLALAWALGRAIEGVLIGPRLPALGRVEIDWRVFLFAAAIAIVACLGASLWPALAGSRVDVVSALKQAGRGQMPSARRMRRVLTGLQVAVSVTLLCGGALLVRSLLARYQVPLGFDTANVLAFSVEPGRAGRDDVGSRQFFRDLLADVRREPGVAAAAVAWIEPFRLIGSGGTGIRAYGQGEDKQVSADMNAVSSGFFSSLGAHLLDGRDFTDEESPPSNQEGSGVMIVNATLARALFGTTDVAGRRVVIGYPSQPVRTIVGVVADIRTRSFGAPVDPVAYEPFGESFRISWGTVHVRLAGPPSPSASASQAPVVVQRVREVVNRLAPGLPIYGVELLSESLDRYLAEDRLVTKCTVLFAGLATLLAAIGLYGLVARGVAERRHEFGVRAALGARPSSIARLVAREALRVSLAGGAAGLVAAMWLSRFITSRLYSVKPADPVSIGVTFAIVAGATLVATLGPASRAAKIDVAEELR
jgi:predicted permease